jgi:adenine-specific DNA glycosylase
VEYNSSSTSTKKKKSTDGNLLSSVMNFKSPGKSAYGTWISEIMLQQTQVVEYAHDLPLSICHIITFHV